MGDVEAAANLVQVFDRGDPLPPNRLDILCSADAGAAATASADRIVCNCNRVNESTLVDAIKAGHGSLKALAEQTRAGTGCGSCKGLVAQLITRHGQSAEKADSPSKNGSLRVGASTNGT